MNELAVSTTLDGALAGMRLGFRPLPLKGKAPASGLIRRTQGTASTRTLSQRYVDEEHVRTWFAEPSVNLGFFTGEVSGGLVVVDLNSLAP